MPQPAVKGIAIVLVLFVPLTGCQSVSDNPKTAIGGFGGAATGGLIAAPAGAGGAGIAAGQLPSPSELRQQFQETDRNGDGRIDREEFHRRSVELFYFLDKDRKGYLMIGDLKGLPARDFRAADREGDGKISLEEFINGRFGNFDAADTNGDGVLTLGEIEVYVNRQR